MPNQHIFKRLSGVKGFLMSAYASGLAMSSNNKGVERELFIKNFLSEVLPPPYRLSAGEITDRKGNITGQLDIVVEYPFLPSIPSFGVSSPRLYLADAIASVIEVKSDLRNQWKEVEKTCRKVKSITRTQGTYSKGKMNGMINSALPPSTERNKIPFISVGYKGWKSLGTNHDAMKKRLIDTGVDAVLIIESGYYFTNPNGELSGTTFAEGEFAFWSLISAIHQTTKYIETSTIRLSDYIDDQAQPIYSPI